MNDKSMQDMVPQDGEGRSIRDVQINRSDDNGNDSNVNLKDTTSEYDVQRVTRDPHYGSNKQWWQKFWVWVTVVVLIIFVVLALTPLISGAQIEITPRNQEVSIDGQFSTGLEGSDGVDIAYQEMTVESTGEETIPATGAEEISRKAEGRIIVYNEYSESPENLIRNTRFESEGGLIYRTPEPITVPGYIESSGEIIPGSIEIEVIADQPGAKYNIESSNFTIPGLQGDPRYEAMHAETETPIEGGFVGTQSVANDEDVSQARNRISARLEESIEKEIAEKVPDEFVYFLENRDVEFIELPTEASQVDGEDMVVVRQRLLASVPIFNKSQLASFIASQTIGTYDGEEVRINNYEDLDIEFSIANDDASQLSISGNVKIIWEVPYKGIQEDMLGKHRDEIDEIFKNYPGIEKASVSISPFWKRTIPEDAAEVEVIEDIN